ncbi:hypothetical protein BC830DRAFT_1126603 [Chytriomyces sp. MP71]|nr:hypothetical protein BC830DRAFT_1126603 [Chytriomyces sp. MP71]
MTPADAKPNQIHCQMGRLPFWIATRSLPLYCLWPGFMCKIISELSGQVSQPKPNGIYYHYLHDSNKSRHETLNDPKGQRRSGRRVNWYCKGTEDHDAVHEIEDEAPHKCVPKKGTRKDNPAIWDDSQADKFHSVPAIVDVLIDDSISCKHFCRSWVDTG